MHVPRPALIPLVLVALAFGAVGYTPPPLLRQELNLQPAETCKNCHLGMTQQWERSAHASTDRTKNLLFGRIYLQSLRLTRGKTLTNCGPCHEPISFVNQDFHFIREATREGVTCVYCHIVASPGPSTGNPPFTLDPSRYHGSIRLPVPTTSHESAYTAYLGTSEFCGGCHQYKNQNGVPISETYTEWKASRYARQGITCQSCHMPGGPGRVSYLGPVRPRAADHAFDPVDLQRVRPNEAATLALRATRGGDSLRVTVLVSNTGWGHSLPTGNDQNLALLRLRVLTAQGAIVWENDPFTEWSQSIFGVILADEVGNWPVETWMAHQVLQNRRIKAGGTARVRYDAPLGDHGGPYRVEAQLLFRRARPNTVEAYNLPEDIYGAERVLAEASLRVP